MGVPSCRSGLGSGMPVNALFSLGCKLSTFFGRAEVVPEVEYEVKIANLSIFASRGLNPAWIKLEPEDESCLAPLSEIGYRGGTLSEFLCRK